MSYVDYRVKAPFLNRTYRYAVVGATTNMEKYGYRVLMDFHLGGMQAVGVNPKYTLIGGVPVFRSLGAIPTEEKPHVAIFVVPPEVGVKVLDEAKAAGITKVWFQPGAESEEIREKAKALSLDASADGACIMVARRVLGI